MLMWQPMYGFASGGPLRFKRAMGHRDLFYLEDKDLEFKDVRKISPFNMSHLGQSLLNVNVCFTYRLLTPHCQKLLLIQQFFAIG